MAGLGGIAEGAMMGYREGERDIAKEGAAKRKTEMEDERMGMTREEHAGKQDTRKADLAKTQLQMEKMGMTESFKRALTGDLVGAVKTWNKSNPDHQLESITPDVIDGEKVFRSVDSNGNESIMLEKMVRLYSMGSKKGSVNRDPAIVKETKFIIDNLQNERILKTALSVLQKKCRKKFLAA